jgi:HEAT repeat protein
VPILPWIFTLLLGQNACNDRCRSHVAAPELRAAVCGRCTPQDRGAWVVALGEQTPYPQAIVQAALLDPDWSVRWGALRAMARAKGFSEARQLAAHVMEAPSGDQVKACTTAARIASSQKRGLNELLEPAGAYGRSSAAICAQRREGVRKELQEGLWAADPVLRQESIDQLAQQFGLAPGQVLVSSLKGRSVEDVQRVAELLVQLAAAGGPPVGAALLKGTSPADKPAIDKLLEIYAGQVDGLRTQLAEPDATRRRVAIARLSDLAPLGAQELEGALADADPQNRLEAARGLARGEGKPVHALAAEAVTKSPRPLTVRWLEAAGRAGEPGCAPALLKVAQTGKQHVEVRVAAFTALGQCARDGEAEQVKPALSAAAKDKDPRVRKAAAAALANLK